MTISRIYMIIIELNVENMEIYMNIFRNLLKMMKYICMNI